MKVLLINGSPHKEGCTYTALSEVAAQLQKHEIETEIFWIGNQPIRGCIDCRSCWGKGRCVFDDDSVNQCIQKIIQADGLVVGSPVYFGGIAGGLKCLLDRVFYDAKRLFSGSIENYKAKFQLVSNAEVYGNCAIACTDNSNIPNLRIVASQAADELLSIQSVTASFVLYPSNGEVSVSARSLGDVNVQILMEALGGGGHLTMSGAQIPGVTMEEAKERLLKVLETTLPKATKFQS